MIAWLMDIIGTGMDATEIDRVASMIARYVDRITHRVFTEGEIAYCLRKRNSAESFAARFAAKEAAMKALGTGWADGIAWRDIEVVRDERGTPSLELRGRALARLAEVGASKAHLSLTHSNDLAMAQVILEA